MPKNSHWPISDDYRQAIVRRQLRDAINPDSSSSDANRAARLLVTMEKQNLDFALQSGDAESDRWNRVMTAVADQRMSHLADHERLEDQRQRALRIDAQPGFIRPFGQSRPLEDGPASWFD